MTLKSARYAAILLPAIVAACSLALGQAPTSQTGSDSDQNLSLADQARRARKDHTKEVQMSDEDAKELFESVDKIIAFAAEDSGFAQHADVKRRLVGSDEVEKFTRQQENKAEFAQRFARSELTMKKFGYLPRDFNLREFLVKANGKDIAAYYDFETKTISMLNWIPLERQAPILAHELTHALQDQNYDLKKWLKDPDAGNLNRQPNDARDSDETPTPRRAVTEGQAQVVSVDYVLQPAGRSLQNTPGIIYQMEDPIVKAVADSELLHSAPMIMREMGTFPYRAGFIFEGELLQKGGKEMAFAGAFARPPRTTHEVLQPKAYLEQEKMSVIHLPDTRPIVGPQYTVYDSGTIGELDVRALLEQFGERKSADDMAAAWMGARYIAYRRTDTAAKDPTTADLALLYISRWKSAQVAERFAHFYAAAAAQRYTNATTQTADPLCPGSNCPISSVKLATDEGPVIIELWPDNTVVVSESFDSDLAARLVSAVMESRHDTRAENLRQEELGMRLYDAPGFAAFQAQIGEAILNGLAQSVTRK
jgi:phosphopantetheinyl transferase (holo-ACP synthase)